MHYIILYSLHCITLHYITLHYITLHYITLHYITLHYITLHYIMLDQSQCICLLSRSTSDWYRGLNSEDRGTMVLIRRSCDFSKLIKYLCLNLSSVHNLPLPLHQRMAQKSPMVHVLLSGHAASSKRPTGRNPRFDGKECDETTAAEWKDRHAFRGWYS